METNIEAKRLVINPQFANQRQAAINGLRLEEIDSPIVEIELVLAERNTAIMNIIPAPPRRG
ncbi:MAG TPA: hypothetical protein VLA72_15405 [Anaerolineales bacterium]|nr:hypothetical protein [Anaerolineales bacterium]